MSRLVDKKYVDEQYGDKQYTPSVITTLRGIMNREHTPKIYSIVWAIEKWEDYRTSLINKETQPSRHKHHRSLTGAVVTSPIKSMIITINE